jgi:hypothetical protein
MCVVWIAGGQNLFVFFFAYMALYLVEFGSFFICEIRAAAESGSASLSSTQHRGNSSF